MIIWIAPVLLWLSGKAQDYIDFLRSVPSLIAPKPIPLGVPYVPPFQGGQCSVAYWVQVKLKSLEGSTFYVWTTGTQSENPDQLSPSNSTAVQGAITGISSVLQSNGANVTVSGSNNSVSFFITNYGQGNDGVPTIYRVRRVDGGLDSCGNVANPNPPPPIADDGLFNPTNPLVANDDGVVNPAAIVLSPAFPLALVAAILAGYQAAMQAAQAALAALDAIKKIAEGLETLKDLWEKLREFLNEWEKNRPKKRDTVRQTYGQLIGDGALDFFPSNNQKYQSIQLDIVITTIPIGFGKYFGSFSPHRYRYKELGYIAFYSTTQGILEVRTLEFKRTSLQIPKLAVGFIYHLGLNDQIRGYAFGTFSVEKS